MLVDLVIEDSLLSEALSLTHLKTAQEVVDLALRTLVKLQRQKSIRHFRGKLKWEGNADIID